MFDLLVDFLFPKFCVGCGGADEDICDKCLRELSVAEQICPMCGKGSSMGWTHDKCKRVRGMDGLVVIFDYEDELVRKIIGEIKFGFNRAMVNAVVKRLGFEMGEDFDLLVPIPLHYYRENWRGFNQAETLAREVGKRVELETENVLKRIRRTKQQSLIKGVEGREKNVKGAFVMKKEFEKGLKGKRVLLVDDVFTSGADMRECTKVLKVFGVKTVWGLALAH